MDPRSTVGYLQIHPMKMGSVTCDPIGYGTRGPAQLEYQTTAKDAVSSMAGFL